MLHVMSVSKNRELHVLERARQRHQSAFEVVVLGYCFCQLQVWFKRFLIGPAFSCVSGVRKKCKAHNPNINLRTARVDFTEGCFPGSLFAFHTCGPLNLLPRGPACVSWAHGVGAAGPRYMQHQNKCQAFTSLYFTCIVIPALHSRNGNVEVSWHSCKASLMTS